MAIYHKHHIIPRHMGGTDDPSNLIELTITEHAEAHLRLWEEHGSEYDLIAYRGLLGMIDRAEVIKQVQTEANIKRWSDPEARKRQSEANVKRWSNPKTRKQQSETIKRVMLTPEARERTSEATKKYYKDLEARERTSEATKRGIAAAKARKAAAILQES